MDYAVHNQHKWFSTSAAISPYLHTYRRNTYTRPVWVIAGIRAHFSVVLRTLRPCIKRNVYARVRDECSPISANVENEKRKTSFVFPIECRDLNNLGRISIIWIIIIRRFEAIDYYYLRWWFWPELTALDFIKYREILNNGAVDCRHKWKSSHRIRMHTVRGTGICELYRISYKCTTFPQIKMKKKIRMTHSVGVCLVDDSSTHIMASSVPVESIVQYTSHVCEKNVFWILRRTSIRVRVRNEGKYTYIRRFFEQQISGNSNLFHLYVFQNDHHGKYWFWTLRKNIFNSPTRRTEEGESDQFFPTLYQTWNRITLNAKFFFRLSLYKINTSEIWG